MIIHDEKDGVVDCCWLLALSSSLFKSYSGLYGGLRTVLDFILVLYQPPRDMMKLLGMS